LPSSRAEKQDCQASLQFSYRKKPSVDRSNPDHKFS